MSVLFLLAFVVTLLLMLSLAFLPAFRSKNAKDFSLAGRDAGSWRVAGAITGTLVGGASTVGTAQMAYLFGLSGWWFTLGAGLACLLLAVGFARQLHREDIVTVSELFGRHFGRKAQLAAALFSAVGMFVHIVAQLLAGSAVLTSLFGVSLLSGVCITTVLVLLITLRQGMAGAGVLGLAKLFILYVSMVVAGFLAFSLLGGWAGMQAAFPERSWFSLFGYGVGPGVSDLLSMLIGVVSTQTYLQALFTAKSAAVARKGAFLSFLLIPPVGLFGVSVGLFMRHTYPVMDSALALPEFFRLHCPPLLAGVAFAAILIAAVGTASGLTLGVATTLHADVFKRVSFCVQRPLATLRMISAVVLLLALSILLLNFGAALMRWSFLSMGLRGATVFLPLIVVLFWRERMDMRYGALAITCAPLAVLATALLPLGGDPLFVGMLVSTVLLLTGFFHNKKGT